MKNNTTLLTDVPKKWEAQFRLRFIEARLFWSGRINRADIINHFGVSQPQASTDLKLYQKLAPGNAIYDSSAKTYRADESFSPIFKDPAMDEFVGHHLLDDGFLGTLPEVESVPSPLRQVDPEIMRWILMATREAQAIKIHYQSMSSPEPRWRWISPHAFGHNGRRWHVRAYCEDREAFLDFVLGRISEVGDLKPRHIDPEEDGEWHEFTDVKFAPHPDLTETQSATIEQEYRMENGTAILSVRRAMLFYVLLQLRLEHDEHRPPGAHIRLVNTEIRQLGDRHVTKRE
ncbi:WYL domain-containing protein [Magnetovibrio sp. PR-2]|uniref:WYL domain-containing protein n=1 Tax=Magnetovibrio sp. PR-2 TaxID=3120356 RepID=UPI002FCE0856